jgi:hypothetical protein
MALVTSDATNGTNNTVAIIATIKMTIRAAKLKFMATSFAKKGSMLICFNAFSLLFGLEQPQNPPNKNKPGCCLKNFIIHRYTHNCHTRLKPHFI